MVLRVHAEALCFSVCVCVVKEISAFQGSCILTQQVKFASHSLQTHTLIVVS